MKKTINVAGMSCSHCQNRIETALKEIGIDPVVLLDKGQVEVEYNAPVTLEQIIEKIEEAGYEAS